MRLVDLGGGRFAHASGALWMPEARALVIADVHLGYAWAMRRRRQLGPLAEGGVNEKLTAVVAELQPATVVLLGDVVHAPRPSDEERRTVERALGELRQAAAVIAVRGNHDRAFARDYGIDMVEHWEHAGVVAVHGDRPFTGSADHVLMGHIHPAIAVIDDAGASQRMPVFLACDRVTALPAFSPFAAGMVVRSPLPEPLRGMSAGQDLRVVAASGRRALALGPLSRVLATLR